MVSSRSGSSRNEAQDEGETNPKCGASLTRYRLLPGGLGHGPSHTLVPGDRQTDSQMTGWRDGRTDGRTDGRAGGRRGGRVGGQAGRRTDAQRERDRQTDRQADRQTTVRQTARQPAGALVGSHTSEQSVKTVTHAHCTYVHKNSIRTYMPMYIYTTSPRYIFASSNNPVCIYMLYKYI